MSAEPAELLDWAEQLSSETEVCRRAAISRAYYAAYHSSKGLPIAYGLPEPADTGSHASLIQSLTSSAGRDISPEKKRQLKSVGYRLKSSRDRRSVADYELDMDVGTDDVTIQLEAVKKIFASIRELNAF